MQSCPLKFKLVEIKGIFALLIILIKKALLGKRIARVSKAPLTSFGKSDLCFKIIVVQTVLTDPDLVSQFQGLDHILVKIPPAHSAVLIADFFMMRTGQIGVVRIRQHQRMLTILMAEIIRDPLFFHQTTDETEIRLPVLDAVGPGGIGSVEFFGEVAESFFGKYLLDNINRRFSLKDAQICGLGQQPQPGNDGGRVLGKNFAAPLGLDIAAVLGKKSNKAVKEALLAISQQDGNRDITANDFFEINAVIMRQEGEFKMKETGNLFRSAESGDEQFIAAQGGCNPNRLVFLGIGHGGHP